MNIQKCLVWPALWLALGAFSPIWAQDAPVDNAADDNAINAQIPLEIPAADGGGEVPDVVTPANAGAAPNPAKTGATAAAARVYVAEEDALSLLPAVLERSGGPGAVSLRASEEAFEANAPARAALLRYVQNGGTVFLHTGAARAFGFQTVEARQGTNQLAGQLFGRARAALPFGANPLLWDDGKTPARRGFNADATLLPGVNVVFYELRAGDHLVIGHPAGTPLLQISDLASNLNGPLYAAAIAPFGRGFAVFAPDFIDQKRADGALFARNLLGLLASSKTAGRKWVAIGADSVENGAGASARLAKELEDAVNQAGPVFTPALPAFGTAPALPNAPDLAAPVDQGIVSEGATTKKGVSTESSLFLGADEAKHYAVTLRAGGDSASAITNLLRARLFLSRGDSESASRAIEASADFALDGSLMAGEVALWRGVLLSGIAQNINQSSVVRSRLLGDAARNFALAATGRMGVTGGAALAGGIPAPILAPDGAVQTGAAKSALSSAVLRAWSLKLGQISAVFGLEPPAVQQFGVGDAAITLRAYDADPSASLVILGVQALADARNFGWRGDREEILLFPTPGSFARYRAALGLNSPTVPLPAGAAGDVVGQRLILVALPSIPLVENNPETGARSAFAIGNNTASVLARLHSYILLNALDEGGARVPVYLQLGLENLVNLALVGQIETAPDNRPLEQFAQVGALLTPAQFETIPADPVRYQVAQLQASAIVTYFYRLFGAGAVVETVQRLGAGQTIETALQATTESDETALFQGWRDAQFGPRRFPNTG